MSRHISGSPRWIGDLCIRRVVGGVMKVRQRYGSNLFVADAILHCVFTETEFDMQLRDLRLEENYSSFRFLIGR